MMTVLERILKNNNGLRIFISLITVLLAVLHAWKPDIKIDSITIILLVVSALPWAQPLIKTVELLGVKIELQELQKQVDEAKGAAASATQQAGLAISAFGSSQVHPSEIGAGTISGEAAVEALAKEYERIRETQPSGSARTAEMTAVVRKMMELAQKIQAFDVYSALEKGSHGKRLYAYAHIYVWPSPDYLGILVRAITSLEDTSFGQYWGIQALSHVITKASNIHLEVIERLQAFNTRLPRGSDRKYELNRILENVE